MTALWHMVIVYLYSSPKAEPWQKCLAQSFPEERPARFRLYYGLHSTEVSRPYGNVCFPGGKPTAAGKESNFWSY